MDELDDHSRGGRLLWVTATGLVVSFIGIGYSAVYAPEMRQRMADAIGSAAHAGTAPASLESTNDISVSVSVPPDIAFTSGAGRVEAVETSGIAIHDRRRGPAVPVPASAPTGGIETTSVRAAATRSGPIPVTISAPVALADAQGRDRKLPDTSIVLLPPEATASGPTTLTSNAQDDQVDGRETGSARGSSAAASSSGSGQNSSRASGSGNTAASGNGSGANSGTGSGQSSSGTDGSQSTGSQGGSTQGGVAGAAGDTVGAAADAAKGAVGGALGAVDHAAGGVLGGGGGVLGKK
jgi:hypothetical protein